MLNRYQLFSSEDIIASEPQSRSPSPVEFLLEYPGSFFNRGKKRTYSEAELEDNTPQPEGVNSQLTQQ